ncbi:MAG: hypothetical protein IRY85_00950 [Micromonosporaceae bacterium]|nr:hypothetical protein [Micromonosporaceae bacterium]
MPLLDKYRVSIDASPDEVWTALGATVWRMSNAGVAALLGAIPPRSAGDPLVTGSAIPGFAVTEATRPHRLVLSGRHRFAGYRLVFTILDRGPGSGTRLIATTYATFPGFAGRLYRAAVIGSGAHRLVMQRLLRRICADVRRRAGLPA